MKSSLKPLIFFVIISTFLGCYKNSLQTFQNTDECDVENMSYSLHIKPIIVTNCLTSGCHQKGTSLTFELEAYNDLKFIADNGLLLNSILHEPGIQAMPKGQSKLADCDIQKIKAWIQQGTLNN